MKRNIFILLIAVSILFVFSTLVFASETIDVEDYIKGKFPIMFNIYLASLEGLDQYEEEFIDLLQNLPEEEQKNFAKEVYNNGFSKEILAKIKDALLLNVPLFLEGAVGEKFPEKSFTWDQREGMIITATGNRVKGCDEFVEELRKVLSGVARWGSRSLLDFTENKRELEEMRNSHTVFMIRPENLEELEKLEAKHPDLLPASCSELKSYSFPLLYFSRDDNKKIRGVIITDEVTPLLAKSLTEDALLLNVPLFLEGAVGEKFPEKSFTWDQREGMIITATGNRVKGCDEFVEELRKVLSGVARWGSRSLLDFTENKRELEEMRNSHTVFMIRPENLEELEKLEAKHPDLLPASCSELKSYSFPLLYFSRDDNKKIRGVIITDEVTPLLAKLLTENALPLDVPLEYKNGQLQILKK